MEFNKIGEYLKTKRLELKMTQQEVAAYLNISCQSISKWENGQSLPSLEILARISILYQISIDEMLKENDDLTIWNNNAFYWDERMGQNSNYCYNKVVRPKTEKLLDIKKDDYILDIACGNGNFSQRMVDLGAKVVAFDFSEIMIECAKKRRRGYPQNIEFKVIDATKEDEIKLLKKEQPYNKAVCLMGLMDISNIQYLFNAISSMLSMNGIFVFAMHHPCFERPNNIYLTACKHRGIAIPGQPLIQNYYHRSLQDIFHLAFENNFIIDGFEEERFDELEIPEIIIVRLKKKYTLNEVEF